MAQSVDTKVKKFFKILSENLQFQKTKISSTKMSRLFEVSYVLFTFITTLLFCAHIEIKNLILLYRIQLSDHF